MDRQVFVVVHQNEQVVHAFADVFFNDLYGYEMFSRNLDDVIRRANNTEYGLASGVFTRDVSRALQFAERIDAGTVFVNTYNKTDVAAPFGGFKQSGFGKDLGK